MIFSDDERAAVGWSAASGHGNVRRPEIAGLSRNSGGLVAHLGAAADLYRSKVCQNLDEPFYCRNVELSISISECTSSVRL